MKTAWFPIGGTRAEGQGFKFKIPQLFALFSLYAWDKQNQQQETLVLDPAGFPTPRQT